MTYGLVGQLRAGICCRVTRFLENRKVARVELGTRIANLRGRSADVSAFVEIETLLGRLDAASDRAIVRFATSRDDPRAVWEAEARPAQDQLSKRVGELVALEGAAFASARSQAAASRASAWYDNSPANKSNPDATKDV